MSEPPKTTHEHRAVARSNNGAAIKSGTTQDPQTDPMAAAHAAKHYGEAMRKYGIAGTVEIQRRTVGEWETVETRPITPE